MKRQKAKQQQKVEKHSLTEAAAGSGYNLDHFNKTNALFTQSHGSK